MKLPRLSRLYLGASCVACAGIALFRSMDLSGTEEGGGRVTGPVIKANIAGGGLLIAAVIAIFFYPRTAAGLALFASLLCVPLYLYTVEPVAFLKLFPGHWGVHPPEGFIWNDWAVYGLTSVLFVIVFSLWNLWQEKV